MVTVNLTMLVYAIPLVAITVAAVAFAFRRPAAQSGSGRRSPIPGIVIGVIGLAVGGSMFAVSSADERTYTTDPSCTAGFALRSEDARACRTASMRIAQWYWSSGRGAARHLVLVDASGRRWYVTYGFDRHGSVWRGLYDTDDRFADVQLFDGQIVLVATASGLATTNAQPMARVNFWALLGIAAGLGGIFSALRAAGFVRSYYGAYT
jgi:hypothetical protein